MALLCFGALHEGHPWSVPTPPSLHHPCIFKQPWNPPLLATSQPCGKKCMWEGRHPHRLMGIIRPPCVASFRRWGAVASVTLHGRKASCAGCQHDRQTTLAS